MLAYNNIKNITLVSHAETPLFADSVKINKFLNDEFFSVNDNAHNYKTFSKELKSGIRLLYW